MKWHIMSFHLDLNCLPVVYMYPECEVKTKIMFFYSTVYDYECKIYNLQDMSKPCDKCTIRYGFVIRYISVKLFERARKIISTIFP